MTSWAEMRSGGRADAQPPIARPADAAGFSVVELLVALSILVISLVALMGLASTSSFMVASSRQRSAMVNAAAGYLDRVRQEPYASVGVAGGDPSGDLASQVTTATPYVITIAPAVSWGRPEDGSNHLLKTVTLTVTSHSISGGSQMSFTASAIVADVGTVGLPVASGTSTPTAVVASPANNTVVWGSSVSVVGSATVSGNRTLVWMDMLDGVQSWGSTVVSGNSAQHTWSWNTVGAREGNHSIVARATDSVNNVGNSAPVVLLVDNVAPSVPGGLSVAFPTNVAGTAWWSASTDGTDVDGVTPLPASHYVVWAYRQPSDTSVMSDYTKWGAVAGLNPLSMVQVPSSGSPLALSGLTAFSRYAVAVSSSSPDRGTSSGLLSGASVLTGVTRYLLTGTWSVSSSNKLTATMAAAGGPTFPWSGTATTTYYRMLSPTDTGPKVVATVSSAWPTWSSSPVTDPGVSGGPYYYKAVTTLVPQGFPGTGQQVSVTSAIMGPFSTATPVGATQMTGVQW